MVHSVGGGGKVGHGNTEEGVTRGGNQKAAFCILLMMLQIKTSS